MTPGFTLNPGRMPPICKGKRVDLVLVCGQTAKNEPAERWRWSRTDHPFDIDQYRIV